MNSNSNSNVTAWMNEVRRLVQALDGRSTIGPCPTTVKLEHRDYSNASPEQKPCKPHWAASYLHHISSGESATPEAAMRSLVAVLRSKLTEKITKQRAELDRLEQADSFTLKAVN